MFYGARGSGKTTRVERALEQLQDEFCCLRFDVISPSVIIIF